MIRLQGNLYSKVLVPVLLLVFVLFAFSDQALASPLSSMAAQQGKPPSFTCVNKPVVQAPPLRDTQTGKQSGDAPPRAAAPDAEHCGDLQAIAGANAGMLSIRPIPCAAYHTEKLNNASGLGASTISTKS